jgi:hypothetical protein
MKLIIPLLLTVVSLADAVEWSEVASFDSRRGDLWDGATPYTYTVSDLPAARLPAQDADRRIAFGDELEAAWTGARTDASYRVVARFLCDRGDRVQQLAVNGWPVIRDLHLPVGQPLEVTGAVPAKALSATLALRITRTSGANTVLTSLRIESTATNKLAARTAALETPQSRLTPLPEEAQRMTLDGTWRFHATPPVHWQAAAPADSGWRDIAVPGEWVMQGIQAPNDQPVAYRRSFTLPTAWAGQRIKLRCNGVYSLAEVWVNGRPAGGHEGGFTPFELDVTDLVEPGVNEIALSVQNDSLADKLASATKYACHPLGGISRSIQLFAVPALHISELHVLARADGQAEVRLSVVNEGNRDAGSITGDLAISPWRTNATVLARQRIELGALAAGATTSQVIRLAVTGIRPWHPESPHLYQATLRVGAEALPLATAVRRFGFRTVEVKGNQFLVNGQVTKLRGVCRHESHPQRGRSLTPELRRQDALLYRNSNVNLVRTSHYPPDESFIEACDELGLFVEEEAPMCWAGGTSAAVRERIVRQTLEMAQRDASHPSIILWSLGNESGWSACFAASSTALHAFDPSRPQTFENGPWGGASEVPDAAYVEVGSDHYPGPGGPAKFAQAKRPINFGEYCHLNAYNRRELATDQGLRDAWGPLLYAMWEKMWAAPGVVGGSLWSGIDDTFFIPDATGGVRAVGYGAWGPIDGWRREKPEYWWMKRAYAPVRVLTTSLVAQAAGAALLVDLENRHDFTDLREVGIRWTTGDARGPAEALVAPHARGTLTLKGLPALTNGAAVEISFMSPRGFLLDTVRLPVGQHPPAVTAGATQAPWPELGGPALMVLPMNGQGETQLHGEEKPWPAYTPVCRDWKQTSTVTRADGAIEWHGTYAEAAGTITMGPLINGTRSFAYEFTMREKLNPRQRGLVFDLPGAFSRLDWERADGLPYAPDDALNRRSGSARADEGHAAGLLGVETPPKYPWAQDGNAWGSADFRSTKSNILSARLTDDEGRGLEVLSDGSQHVRAWREDDRIRLLVADYSNAGSERFLGGHSQLTQRPLKVGDVIRGGCTLRVVSP